MNNFIFGDETFGYYETIAGGSGAGPGYDGSDAIHTHMTNTAITDPEILESRYPVKLHRFSIRKDSGGEGTYRGGNGVIREVEFLAPLTVSLLTQHRKTAPYGLNGGSPGAMGKQTLIRANGETIELPTKHEVRSPPRRSAKDRDPRRRRRQSLAKVARGADTWLSAPTPKMSVGDRDHSHLTHCARSNPPPSGALQKILNPSPIELRGRPLATIQRKESPPKTCNAIAESAF